MADNYLERKMEEYQASKGGKKRVIRRMPTGAPRGTINVKFAPCRVYVTGGARGIGREIVETFIKSGCRVAFCDVDDKQGALTAQATGAQFHPVDVRDVKRLEDSLTRVAEAWGDIDVIVNNVGVGNFKPLVETTVEDFDDVLAVNLRPVFVTARWMALRRQSMSEMPNYGRIINLSSTRYVMSEPDTVGYAASKGGVSSLTHALMASMSPYNVTVNCISPGWIECENYDTLTEVDHHQHPSGRVGRPADIARVCLFLATPDNDFINGENIVVDGGMTRKMIYV